MQKVLERKNVMNLRKAVPRMYSFEPVEPEQCIAKTRTVCTPDGMKVVPGCTLEVHLRTACQILCELKNVWKGYPFCEQIRPEAEWLAALHDIGKCTPAFLIKIYDAMKQPLPWKGQKVDEDPGGHAKNSEIILFEQYGKTFAKLAGAHHGDRFWPDVCRGDFEYNKECLGGEPWKNLRKSLMQKLEQELELPPCDLKTIRDEDAPLILGAAILADWLSSGMDLKADTKECPPEMLHKAVTNAGLIPAPWQSSMTFENLFGFSPNSMQQECAKNFCPGGVYIIESGMGSGKTEAALGLAYRLISERKANGIYFAMPTRLTSEKIHERLKDFLEKAIPEKNIEPLLIHGEAWLDWLLPQPTEKGFEDGRGTSSRPGSWFQTKKRALLAQFAAGTVDQALLSVVNCRHKDLRAFALAGKVVILDEVHSYDCYTSTLIEELIRNLRYWGATVIILSATLTQRTRCRLLGQDTADSDAAQYPYPAISVLPADGGKVRTIAVASQNSQKVMVSSTFDELAAMQSAMNHASAGEQVLWIENTVDKAQEVFRQFSSAASGVKIGLIHSRFPASERKQREGDWVDLLGKHGVKMRKAKGRILVATQILEQSVDVDADYLVTRLAPCDMLFQRIGRLWRHPGLNEFRPAGAQPRVLILCPEQVKEPEQTKAEQLKAELLPYDAYCVMRTFEVWKDLHEVQLPCDIRPLLEKVYEEREEEGVMKDLLRRDEDNEKKSVRKAHIACGKGNPPINEESFSTHADDEGFVQNLPLKKNNSTRISDEETVQVLLLKKDNCGDSLEHTIHPLFSETPVVLPPADASRLEKTRTAKLLLKAMITVRESLAPEAWEFPVNFLSNVLWTGDGENHPIRAAYVDDTGILLSQSGSPCGKYELSWHPELGYCVRKDKK